MLARAFGVDSSFIWGPLTLLIGTFLRDKVKFRPTCGSEKIVKNGHNYREAIPDVQMFTCKECGRKFCERANTIFYWNHASMGELFIVSWIFYGIGSRRWPRKWISDLGESSLMDSYVRFSAF